MSMVSKAVQSAKSVLKKVPGSGNVVRLLEKTKASTEGELDSKSVAKLFEADKKDYPVIASAPVQMTPEELEKICNVSRLKERHHALIHGKFPPVIDPDSNYSNSYAYQRKMFARFGAASGVDPRKIWPSEEEIKSAQTLSSLRYTMTTDDVLETVKINEERAKFREAKARERDEKVAANVLVSEKLKEKMWNDALKLEKELNEAEEKRNKRIEQVRRFFQYTLDVKDPRFREKMVEMITSEKQALKAKSKESKKKERELHKAQKEAEKARAIRARQEAKAKSKDGDSSDDE